MASPKNAKLTKTVSFAYLHKLSCLVSLIGFLVVVAGGILAQTRVTTIVWRSFLVVLAVGIVTRVVIRVLATYEEMNSGKA